MIQWLSLRTAPRDGSRVLLYSPFRQEGGLWPEVVGAWAEDIRDFADDEGYPLDPSAWAPLPATSPAVIDAPLRQARAL